MILVTGATGHFGSSSIQFLLQKGFPAKQIKALVRSGQSADELLQQGVSVAFGNYDDFASLESAFDGVEKLLFISGSDIGKRLTQHENIVRAAKTAGVKHVIYTSFQRKDETETSPLWPVAQSHIQTEKWLKESGLAYTILKNNLYMDFLPGFIGDAVLERGSIYLPAENGKVAAVLRSEMAEAAANILLSTGHAGKEYHFTNTEALSYPEIAQVIAEVSGKAIGYYSPSADEYTTTLLGYGLPSDAVGIFSSFAVAQAKGELDNVSTDLEQLLGRRPITVRNFIRQVYTPKK